MNFLNGDPEPQPQIIKKSHYVRNVTIAIIVILLLAASGAAYYFYNQWDTLKKNPNKVAQDETKSLVETVGRIILLPTGEDPTIATVTEPDKLKGQDFFKHAKVGDKVLVYAKAKTAYLYDPAANKILNVSPISPEEVDSSQAAAQTSGTTITNTPQTTK